MVTTEEILQTINTWQLGEVIAVRRKKCLGASSRPTVYYIIILQYWKNSPNSAFSEHCENYCNVDTFSVHICDKGEWDTRQGRLSTDTGIVVAEWVWRPAPPANTQETLD